MASPHTVEKQKNSFTAESSGHTELADLALFKNEK